MGCQRFLLLAVVGKHCSACRPNASRGRGHGHHCAAYIFIFSISENRGGGAGGRELDLVFPEAVGNEVDDVLLHREGSGDAEERGGLGEDDLPLEHPEPEDDVHQPGLVLKEAKRAREI